MSLINDMLRDLDARRQHPARLDNLVLQGVGPSLAQPTAGFPLGRLLLGVGLAVALALAGLQLMAPRAPTLPAAETPRLAAVPARVAEPHRTAPVVAVEPVPPPMDVPVETTVEAPVEAPPPMAVAVSEPPPAAAAAPTPAVTAPPARETTSPARDRHMETRVRTLTADEQARERYEEGAAALRREQARRAETLWREALTLQPAHTETRLALAGLQLRQQRQEEALALLAAGLSLDPQAVELAQLRGHLLLQLGRLQEARRVLETAAPGASEQADYQALLATLYQRLGQHEQAVGHYRQALALQPDQGLWWMGLGVSLDQTQQGQAAGEAFRTALGYPLGPALQQYIQGRLTALAR